MGSGRRGLFGRRGPLGRAAGLGLAGMALGAWMLAWGGAAEAHEPSRAGGAPSVISATVAFSGNPSLAGGDQALWSRHGSDRRTWNRRGSTWRHEPRGWVTLRGGFFDTDHVGKDDWLLGLKATGGVGQILQLGVSLDWQRRSEASRVRIEEYIGPGGNPVQATVTTYESASNLVPILGVVELRPAVGDVRPYLGIGAGYEALVVEVRDYRLAYDYHDDFGGFGWQPYAGVGVAFSRDVQLVGEFYANFATVSRTVRDIDTGYRVKEEIEADGIGVRGGVSIAF